MGRTIKTAVWMLGIGVSVAAACASAGPGKGTAWAAERLPVESLKVIFVIDQKRDTDRTFGQFLGDDPAGLEARAKSMKLDPAIARRIRDSNGSQESYDELKKIVGDRYRALGDAIEIGRQEYVLLWRDFLPLFSSVVTELSDQPWLHEQYESLVSVFCVGMTDWHGNRVGARYDLKPLNKRRILAHEIALSHAFQILRKKLREDELNDKQVWAFSEITAVLFLDDPRLREFWPNYPRVGSYFARSNYPGLAALELELKQLFDARKNFDEYLVRAFPALQRFN